MLRDPLRNKGSAFTASERSRLGLEGLLPYRVQELEGQARRTENWLNRLEDPLEKYVALASLQDRNETLYFHVLSTHLEELLPVVYTPTVAVATQRFSQVFRRGRGIWITPDMAGRISDVLAAATCDRNVQLIVATDNEAILGIGDQGAGGMAISVGKLALYTAAAGIHPATVLPVSLDVGTDNEALLADPLYLGWPEQRLRGERYLALLDEFVAAVKALFPGALIQWEDFRKDNALAVLNRYQDSVCSFNDDIQGTGATAVAGLMAACRAADRDLRGERVLILGAGAAGLGIQRQIRTALEAAGLTQEQSLHAVAALDSRGLVFKGREGVDSFKSEMAWDAEFARESGLDRPGLDVLEVVRRFRPTALIGTSGQAGAFSESIVRQMTAHIDRPIILPLSNPTDQSEARPADLYEWTDGRCLTATGSPFPPVSFEDQVFQVGQGNNAMIFPGVGLGALACGVRVITEELFTTAAHALAQAVTDADLAEGLLYPRITELRQLARAVALAVATRAQELGLAEDSGDLHRRLDRLMWRPAYDAHDPDRQD